MSRRLESFLRAVARLEEALVAPETPLNRDAAIQRFEFCFELAWKCIQETARGLGLDSRSPKHCLKLAFQQDWIEDETGWMAVLEDRNRTAHTYDEELARSVYRRLSAHHRLLERLAERLSQAVAAGSISPPSRPPQ